MPKEATKEEEKVYVSSDLNIGWSLQCCWWRSVCQRVSLMLPLCQAEGELLPFAQTSPQSFTEITKANVWVHPFHVPEGWCCFLAMMCVAPVVFLSHILKPLSAGALFYSAVWIISSEPFKSLKSVPPNTQHFWTRLRGCISTLCPRAPGLCGSAALGVWDYWDHGEIVPSLLLDFSDVSNWCHVRGREVEHPESPLWITPPFTEVVWPCAESGDKGSRTAPKQSLAAHPAKGRTSSPAWL